MNHIDLFSGIGGFAYAARQVWPDYRNLFFCDCNTFCQAVLRKNFGQDSLIYGDIREVTVEQVIKDTIGSGRAYGKPQEEAAEVRGQRVAGAGDGHGVRDGAVIADTARIGLCSEENKQELGGAWGDQLHPRQSRNMGAVIADTEPTGLEGCEKKQRNGGSGKRGEVGQGLGATDTLSVDLLTGGFPCQPFSAAGKRKGRDDERHLWPEMYRVIKAFRPRWVIGENVRGLVNIENGMALQQVFLDLESIGYAVQAFIIPACAVNAPHRRDRIWIVARLTKDTINSRNGGGDNGNQAGLRRPLQTERSDRHAADTDSGGLEGTVEVGRDSIDVEREDRDVADTGNKGLQGIGQTGNENGDGKKHGNEQPDGRDRSEPDWNRPWLDIAIETCSRVRRVHDGVPKGLYGFELTASKHREERLKALGNAIVPQVAIEIMRAIKECE